MIATLPEADAAHVVADVLGEEGLELERPPPLIGIGGVEGGLWLPRLERVDDPVESMIRLPSRSSTGSVPSPRENAIARGPPGITERRR